MYLIIIQLYNYILIIILGLCMQRYSVNVILDGDIVIIRLYSKINQ